jgi:DNA adenine methylase
VVKTNFKKLEKETQCTLHSRDLHQTAKIVLGYPQLFDEVKRAWAIWTMANESYAAKLNGNWGYDKKENRAAKVLQAKRESFLINYAKRLEQTEIENRDALKVIGTWDTKDTFFYIDPPYINTNQGHYKGYTEEDFEKLLIMLSKIKGKFVLSSYPSGMLNRYIKENEWTIKKNETVLSITTNSSSQIKRKVEFLVRNYDLQS